MATSINSRQQKARARKRASGLRKYELWLHPFEWAQLRTQLQVIIQSRTATQPKTPL